jgi:tetratricopeptide (TPR) repeat protein
MARFATVSWMCVAACLMAGAALAQDLSRRSGEAALADAARLVEEAAKLHDGYQFAKSLATYLSIPDTAAPEHRVAKHTGAALSLINMGRGSDAGPHLELARPLVDQAGTDFTTVRFLNAEGLYLNAVKRGDRGLAALHRAVEIAERAGATAALRTVYGSLAIVYQSLEDYERQAYYSQKIFDLNPNPTPIDRFRLHIERGIAFFEMYERDDAEQEFRRALELSAVTKRPRDRAFVLGELAFLYWTFDRDADRALPLYDEAIELAIEAKVASMEANWRTNRGNVYRDTGDYAKAETDYRDALAILERGGQTNSGFHIWKNLGQVRRLQGHDAEAAAFLERVIKERGHTAGLRHTWQARMELASAYAAIGERERAEQNFRAMLDVLEEHRNTAILDAFRTGTLAHQLSAYDPYERYIRFLVEANPARAEEALAISERAHARGFLEALASVRGAVASKLPPALLAEESRIRRAISSAQEKLRAADVPKADRDALVAELERAEQEEHPSLAEARYPTLLDTKSIQAALRADEIAVAFFLAEPNSYRWMVSKEHVIVDRVAGRSAVEKTSIRLRPSWALCCSAAFPPPTIGRWWSCRTAPCTTCHSKSCRCRARC